MLKRDLSMSPSAAKLAVAQEKPPLAVPAKCTTLFVPTAAQPARFPLSRGKTVRFIAASALQKCASSNIVTLKEQ